MITFLGDVALVSDNLESEYKPTNPYIFNLEYVIKDDIQSLVPTLDKINLSSNNYEFENVFGTLPIAVNVVNNHIFDFGEDGFKTTVSKVNDLGIIDITDEPVFISDTICLFSYILLDKNKAFQFDYEKAKNAILKAKNEKANARIVVQMHWGIENCSTATEEQQKVGHWLIDNGVDLVIGHHPHCVQPAEEYKGKMIFYSLGNSLFGNINTPSHYNEKLIPQRVYRFKWQRWNRKTLAVNYDEDTNTVLSVDYLYQKRNRLICQKRGVLIKDFMKKRNTPNKPNNLQYTFRKYFLFLISNSFVDGKVFDMSALKHELREKNG